MPCKPRRIAPPLASIALAGLFCLGCVRVGDFSRNATRYNEAIEEAQNRMLLLNIIRAEMRRPMYITDLSKITGNIKVDFNTGGVKTDYGPFVETQGTTNSATSVMSSTSAAHYLFSGEFVPSLDYAHTPTFDVNALSTQEFMNGFLKPVSKDLFAYYWEQGWPQELLIYLFVKEVQVRSVDNDALPEERYVNYPDAKTDLKDLERFGQWVTGFVQRKPLFVRKDQNFGPCLERNEASDLEDLVRAAQASLGLAEVGGKYQLQQAKPDLFLMGLEQAEVTRESELICKRVKDKGEKQPVAEAEVKKACEQRALVGDDAARKQINEAVCADLKALIDGQKIKCSDPCSATAGAGGAKGSRSQGASDSGTKHEQISAQYQEGPNNDRKEATLILRGPEGVLYYLGELMRVEKDDFVPEICIHGHLQPLFVAFLQPKLKPSCTAAIAVPYGGAEYMIPDSSEEFHAPEEKAFACSQPGEAVKPTSGPAGNKYFKGLEKLHCSGGDSMQALSLLTQLIALQKSAKDTPTTSVIRAIAQ
jgi:hypothetical protein